MTRPAALDAALDAIDVMTEEAITAIETERHWAQGQPNSRAIQAALGRAADAVNKAAGRQRRKAGEKYNG